MSQVYLLAAGHGRRSGGPKAWRNFNGEPLLKKQIEFLLSRFDAQNITVSIQKDWLSQCLRICASAHWVEVDPDQPPLASLIEMIRASRMGQWSFIYHVDQPVWEPELWDILAHKTQGAEPLSYAPTFAGRRGHPVLISHGLGPEILALDGAHDRLDLFLKSRATEDVPVPFACVHENWNQLEQRLP